MVFAAVVATHAGGALETVDITGRMPSPIAGQLVARVIGIKWDTRAIPVQYRVNSTLNPIPNPLGPAFLSLDAVTAELQAALDAWNDIETSFIEMRIVGTTSNPGVGGFDFVNEVTFRTATSFPAIASSPFVALIEDVTLVDGARIDNDADADVSGLITAVTDVDGDGDLEFPAGFYKAGTILDNDVQFNTKVSSGLRFTIDPAAADIVTRSVDLFAVAVHEFGHSQGLAHSMNNQSSATDGGGATMFPFIDTGDPQAELSQRTLDIDDIAYSSYFYPEGSAKTGLPALQPGDVAFRKRFGLITGELRHGVLDQPLAGGNVFTVNKKTNTASTSAFSGTTQLSYRITDGQTFVIDPTFSILDGNYVIPVAKGRYRIGIEPVDGRPVAAAAINFTTQVGALLGQQDFNEEFVARTHVHRLGDTQDCDHDHAEGAMSVGAGDGRTGIDITTGVDISIDNFGSRNFIGFTGLAAGRYYAVRIPASQFTDARQGRDVRIKALAFDTAVVDASAVPTFAEAILATGLVNPDGSATIDLAAPLAQTTTFVGQDDDMAPFFVKRGKRLGRLIARDIESGAIENLFLVLRVPTTTPFPGVSAVPPLIGLDGGVPANDVPILGLSFMSEDGGVTFTRVNNFNFRFSLRMAEVVPRW